MIASRLFGDEFLRFSKRLFHDTRFRFYVLKLESSIVASSHQEHKVSAAASPAAHRPACR